VLQTGHLIALVPSGYCNKILQPVQFIVRKLFPGGNRLVGSELPPVPPDPPTLFEPTLLVFGGGSTLEGEGFLLSCSRIARLTEVSINEFPVLRSLSAHRSVSLSGVGWN